MLEHPLGLLIIGMLFEQIEQDAASLVPRAIQSIDARQIEICLIETGGHADALFEACHRLIAPLSDQIEHSQIVQRFRVSGTSLQCALCANTIPKL